MKKFLSVMLALAVAFTFTFGSTMSAFAATKNTKFIGYTIDEAKAIAQMANAEATVDDYVVDYDGKSTDAAWTKDLTTYTISAADVATGLSTAYDDLYAQILAASGTNITAISTTTDVSTATNVPIITHVGNADNMIKMTGVAKSDASYIAAFLASQATVGDNLEAVEKVAFEGYRAYLLSLVDKVDLSVYTTTKKDSPYTAADGKYYYTAKEAAEADVAVAKAIINNAKFNPATSTDLTNNKTEQWTVASYADLYNAVFAYATTTNLIKVTPVMDTVDTNKVASLTYKLSASYATTSSEAGEEATLAAAQAEAKAKLAKKVADYKATDYYVAANQDTEINAYVEAMTYLIDNGTKASVTNLPVSYLPTDAALTTATYTGYAAKAKAFNEDMATAKTKYTTLGYTWDDEAAAKATKYALTNIYTNGTTSVIEGENGLLDTYEVISSGLTAGAKATLKIDYSKVEAVETTFTVGSDSAKADVYQIPVTISGTQNNASIGATPSNLYFEKQWDSVKTAIDTYNTAIDAAKDSLDVQAAKNALYVAVNKIATASAIKEKVDDVDLSTLKTYAKLTLDRAKAADSTISAIYVTFTITDEAVTTNDLNDASVCLWYIANGATTKAEAEAMYTDACKVIDAYKTLPELKKEAAEVTALIAALPEAKNVALTDKDAIVAAYDAYTALGDTAKQYVTNTTKLTADIKALEPLEAYAVKAQVAALPLPTAVTVADKEAVKAAKAAVEAYEDTTAYEGNLSYDCGYSFDTALNTTIKGLEGKAIKTAYDALSVKYQANTLTAEDAAALKAVQDALAAYIDEYASVPDGVSEFELSKIAAVIDSAIAEAEWTTTDVKASLFDTSRKLTIWRTSKTSIRVTSVGSVADIKDHGYTVQYKFYKKAPGATSYKLVKTTSSNKYTYTNLKKGTNKFQVKVVVKDADGKVVASKWTYYRAAKIK